MLPTQDLREDLGRHFERKPAKLVPPISVLVRLALVPAGEAGRVLFEFDPATQPAAEIARAMRRLEADGFRQFGLAGFPAVGFDAVWPNLSLRSQPLLP